MVRTGNPTVYPPNFDPSLFELVPEQSCESVDDLRISQIICFRPVSEALSWLNSQRELSKALPRASGLRSLDDMRRAEVKHSYNKPSANGGKKRRKLCPTRVGTDVRDHVHLLIRYLPERRICWWKVGYFLSQNGRRRQKRFSGGRSTLGSK